MDEQALHILRHWNPQNIEQARAQNKEWNAAEKIAEKLKEKKMNQLTPVLKAAVLGQKGPLVEGEIDRTKDYARELAVKLKEEKVWDPFLDWIEF